MPAEVATPPRVRWGEHRLCPECGGKGRPWKWVKGKLVKVTCTYCRGFGVVPITA